MEWRRQRDVYAALVPKVQRHLEEFYGGERTLDEAWDDFHLGADTGFDPNSPILPLFMPWFHYAWRPDPELSRVPLGPHRELTPALSLLRTHGDQLTELERKALQATGQRPFSFFEVLECRPGTGFKLRDLLTFDEFDVLERQGSQRARQADLLYAKIGVIDGVATLLACSPFLIQPQRRITLVDLRKDLQEAASTRHLKVQDLEEFEYDIHDAYLEFQDEFLNPRAPVLANTDGDRMVPQTLVFEIDSADRALEALAPLCFERTLDSLQRQAERDPQGKLLKLEFPWLRKGHRQNPEWSNTVLGHLTLEPGKLTAQVNSEARAERLQHEVRQRIGPGVRLKSRLIEPLDGEVERLMRNRVAPSPPDRKGPDALEPAPMTPAQYEAIAAIHRKHWEGWISQRIPALGNRTPKQAARSREGRELLESLLTQFERRADESDLPGVSRETFQEIRRKLKLE